MPADGMEVDGKKTAGRYCIGNANLAVPQDGLEVCVCNFGAGPMLSLAGVWSGWKSRYKSIPAPPHFNHCIAASDREPVHRRHPDRLGCGGGHLRPRVQRPAEAGPQGTPPPLWRAVAHRPRHAGEAGGARL